MSIIVDDAKVYITSQWPMFIWTLTYGRLLYHSLKIKMYLKYNVIKKMTIMLDIKVRNIYITMWSASHTKKMKDSSRRSH